MPEFDLIDFYSGSFTRYHHTGNFSSLNLVFLLERDPGYYLIHMYLPLTLTVLMSWHALWFKVEIPQARMVLSVNCLFTAVTVANDARSSIPRVSYLKMADVWITACILFIYGLILVSSMVNFMSRMKLRPVIMRKVDQGLGDMWHVWKHGTPSDDFLLKLDKANKLEHHRNLKRSESDYDMDMYLRLAWKDPRLSMRRFGINRTLTLNGQHLLSRMWKPDLFFVNAKEVRTHSVTIPNELLQLSPDGDILISIR
ncbi:glycine receptor subunit alpha-2-like [Ixodes scapularis]